MGRYWFQLHNKDSNRLFVGHNYIFDRRPIEHKNHDGSIDIEEFKIPQTCSFSLNNKKIIVANKRRWLAFLGSILKSERIAKKLCQILK